jgi:hypothetical protein
LKTSYNDLPGQPLFERTSVASRNGTDRVNNP